MAALSADEWNRRKAVLEEHGGNVTAAARALGIARGSLRCNLGNREDDGFRIVAKSTLYDGDGNEKLQWVKESLDRERLEELVRITVNALISDIPAAPKILAPKKFDPNLLVALQIGDAHLGSYSWGPECSGGSFDLNIAEADLMAAVDRLIASTPDAEECLVVNVGDWFHTDTSKPFTPASGNLLDIGDSRWPKVISSGVRILRNILLRALTKFKRVRLRNAKGNHDPHSAIILDVAMRAYFDNNPRVIIEDSPRDMWWLRFGANLMAVTHGHNIKLENLPGVLAVDAREEWGQCEFRHIWVGHWHAHKVLDIMGTRVTVWPTLAANDKWHSEKGYRSLKEMIAVVLHKDDGVIEQHTAGLKRIRGAADGSRQRAA
jgi:hypothetical protein